MVVIPLSSKLINTTSWPITVVGIYQYLMTLVYLDTRVGNLLISRDTQMVCELTYIP